MPTSSAAVQGITNVDLAGRSKNLYAVWKKMQTKGCDLEGLHDLRALRLVVRGPQGRAACYELLKEVWPGSGCHSTQAPHSMPTCRACCCSDAHAAMCAATSPAPLMALCGAGARAVAAHQRALQELHPPAQAQRLPLPA